jgi:hypothetical protein
VDQQIDDKSGYGLSGCRWRRTSESFVDQPDQLQDFNGNARRGVRLRDGTQAPLAIAARGGGVASAGRDGSDIQRPRR